MKKIIAILTLAFILITTATSAAFADANKLADFSENFDGYSVSGDYIENDSALTEKWDNNVFRGGDPLGMDSHIVNVGKIEYENGSDGNRVLHLKNTTGANTFFYMGPSGDYRVKNFTASFRLKFLTEDVEERSWVGISFRKKANSHYTGTNNLMFVVQRYVEATAITGHAYAIFDGGSPNDLNLMRDLYGEKLSLTEAQYSVPNAVSKQDLPWVTYSLSVRDNRYVVSVDGTVVLDCTFAVPTYDYFGYLSLNCCTSNILVDDFTVTVQDETLPPEILPLATPVISLDEENKMLTWNAVESAGLYRVAIGDTVKTVTATKYALDKLKPGTYEITVTALSDDTFVAKDSAPSSSVTYTVASIDDETPSGGCNSSIGGGFCGIFVLSAAALTLKRRKRK